MKNETIITEQVEIDADLLEWAEGQAKAEDKSLSEYVSALIEAEANR